MEEAVPRTLRAPSPLAGEGWGGGSFECALAAPPSSETLTPTPNPSPQGGGEPACAIGSAVR
jgi:hypothetical protein